MHHILKFSPGYFLITFFLFLVEIMIALFVHDHFIRPYLGDVLVVILIYCFIKSFFSFPVLPTAIAVLLFSFLIELLQYWQMVKLLGLQPYKLARIVIGTSFSWQDIFAYTAGIGIVLLAENRRKPV